VKKAESIERLLSRAFVAFGVVLGALFGTVVVLVFLGVEDRLVEEQLSGALGELRVARSVDELPEAVRAWARDQPPGLHELQEEGWETHLLVSPSSSAERFVLRRRPEEEGVERSLTLAVLSGVLLTSLVGFLVARRLAAGLGGPLARLAARLESGDGVSTGRLESARYRELEVLEDALAASSARAREALERERRFVRDVSHELRTPLTVIGGACELLEGEGMEPRVAARVERIRRATDSSRETVEALLALAREEVLWAEREGHEDPLESLMSTLRELRSLASSGVEYRVHLEGSPAVSVPDLPLLKIALTNLVRNALEHTASGSVQLKVGESAASVEDTGPGLPGFPGLPGEAGAGHSPGLGLPMVRRIAQRCGWSFTLEGREQGGAKALLVFEPLPGVSPGRQSAGRSVGRSVG